MSGRCPKSRIWILVICVAVAVAALACRPGIEVGQRTLYVSARTTPCVQDPAQTCYLVRDREEDPWAPLQAEIVGFERRPGYEYQIVVDVEPLEGTDPGFRLVMREVLLARRVSPTETPTPAPSATPTLTPQPTPTPVLGWDMLKNGTYLSERIPGGQVTLEDAVYRYTLSDGSSIIVVVLERIANGDLNGDGQEDAVGILATSVGGGAVHYELAALLNRDGTPEHVDSAYLGDRIQVREVTIADGLIHVVMTVHGPGEAPCCPSYDGEAQYRLEESTLVQQ